MSRATNKYRTKVDLNADEMSVDISIVDKGSNEVVASDSFPAHEIHESVRPQVSLYGYSKLLQDRVSDVPIGPEKLDAMKEVAAQLGSGQWAKERKIGAVVTSPEVEALARLKQISVPQAQAALKDYPKEVREKILANPKIVELAAQIRAERDQAESVSLDDLAADEAAA
mgnify:FL=1